MDSEVNPAVLAYINEKRLQGEKRSPAEILSRLGVLDARQKSFADAWLAAGGNVVATLWAERLSVSPEGRWFHVESLDAHHRAGGGERSAQQVQRAKDRLALLKRSLGPEVDLRVALQTNRVPIAELETSRIAKVSTRIADEQPWHVALWEPDQNVAVLVRGARDWLPGEDDMQAARARSGIAAVSPPVQVEDAAPDAVRAAAMAHLTRHFAGYGYQPVDVSAQGLGYDLEVKDKKGITLLKLAVKGTAPGVASFRLTAEERACALRGDPWRLAVVSDAVGPAAQHKLYKPSEMEGAPGLEQPL